MQAELFSGQSVSGLAFVPQYNKAWKRAFWGGAPKHRAKSGE